MGKGRWCVLENESGANTVRFTVVRCTVSVAPNLVSHWPGDGRGPHTLNTKTARYGRARSLDPSAVKPILYSQIGDQHTAHVVRAQRWAHRLVAGMPVSRELAQPQALRSALLPTLMRAGFIEPLVLGTASPHARLDFQVVIAHLGLATDDYAIPTIAIPWRMSASSSDLRNGEGPFTNAQFFMIYCAGLGIIRLAVCVRHGYLRLAKTLVDPSSSACSAEPHVWAPFT